MRDLKGALPADLISANQYPKVFAWIDRFNQRLAEAKKAMPKPTALKGDAAAQRILGAVYTDEVGFNASDPLGLSLDQEVEVWPTDSGFRHKDRGALVALDDEEIVIAIKPAGKELRLHYPRTGFRVAAVSGSARL